MEVFVCLLFPYLRHSMQTMVIKEEDNPHLCYDASTTRKPTNIVMNQVTTVAGEALITFIKVKIKLYTNIYNTRISHPLAKISLAMGNIKTCLCFEWIHTNLTGAFGFIANNLYNIATATLFGSTTSALSWEPFRYKI
jgi:hypothetical protein